MGEDSHKTVVIYKSKYGSTKRYAEWIAAAVQADLVDRSKVALKDLLPYDIVVYGGSLYATGILGLSLIKKNFPKLADKKIIVFSVGASPAHPEALNNVKNHNFTEEMKQKVHFFHLRGGFNYKKLNPLDKFLMFLLKKKLEHKNPAELTDDEKGLLASFNHPVDWTNKAAILPILEAVNSTSP